MPHYLHVPTMFAKPLSVGDFDPNSPIHLFCSCRIVRPLKYCRGTESCAGRELSGPLVRPGPSIPVGIRNPLSKSPLNSIAVTGKTLAPPPQEKARPGMPHEASFLRFRLMRKAGIRAVGDFGDAEFSGLPPGPPSTRADCLHSARECLLTGCTAEHVVPAFLLGIQQ